MCALDSRTAPEPFYHADRVLDFNVLVYVSEGAIYVTEDGTDYTAAAGSLLFLKNGLRHFGKYEIPKSTSWAFVHFYLPEPELPEFVPDIGEIGVYELLESRAMLPKQLSGLGGSNTERRLYDIITLSHSRTPDKRFRLNIEFGRLLTGLLPYISKEPSLADRIERWLEEHCCEPFSSGALEREFFLSYKRLAAVFRQEKGISMQQLHSRFKLSRAAMLLRTTALSVNEVAAAVGMSDALYFSRCFSREFSLPPTEYRRKMLGNY